MSSSWVASGFVAEHPLLLSDVVPVPRTSTRDHNASYPGSLSPFGNRSMAKQTTFRDAFTLKICSAAVTDVGVCKGPTDRDRKLDERNSNTACGAISPLEAHMPFVIGKYALQILFYIEDWSVWTIAFLVDVA